MLAIQYTDTFKRSSSRSLDGAAEGCCSYIQIELSSRACTVADVKSIAGLAFIDQAIIIKYSCENALYKPSFDYK